MTTFVIIIAVIIAVTVWVAHSWWFPFQRCPSCLKHSASGRGIGSTWRAYNRCWRCGGKGELVRTSAKLISMATGKPVRGSKP